MENIESNLQIADLKHENLRKSLEQLQAQSSSLLSFSLQWKDLQQYFDSTKTLIDERLKSLDERAKEVELTEKQLGLTQASLNECSKELQLKEENLSTVQNSLLKYEEELDINDKRLRELKRLIQESLTELENKENCLNSVKVLIQDHDEEVEKKENYLNSVKALIQDYDEELEKKEKDYKLLQKSMRESSIQLNSKKEELASVTKLLGEYQMKGKVEEENLRLIEKKLEKCSKELESKEKQLNFVREQLKSYCRDIELKDREFAAIRRSIEERNQYFEAKGEELHSMQTLLSECENQIRSKEKEFGAMQSSIQEYLEAKERKLKILDDLIIEREKEVNSKEGEFRAIYRNIEQCDMIFQTKKEKLDLIEELIVERANELKLKDREYGAILEDIQGSSKELETKEDQLKSIQKRITDFNCELKTKEEQLDLMQKSIIGYDKELDLKRKGIDDLVAKENELKSIQDSVDQRTKELTSNEKELASLKQLMKERFLNLETGEKQCQERVMQLELKEKHFEGRLKKLELEEKQLGVRVKELASKENRFESLRKSFEEEHVLKEKSNLLLTQVKAEPQDFINGWSSRDSRNLQVLFVSLLEKYELVCNEVHDAFRISANPAKLVLDAMQGFNPLHMRLKDAEYDAKIIKRTCILLLDELEKSSAVIDSDVKRDAMELASRWKANITVGNEDCLEALRFLKLVAAYKLGSSFDANELQRLLNIVSDHCQGFGLSQALGDVKKVPDNQSSETIDGRGVHFLLKEQSQANGSDLMGNEIFNSLQTSPDPAKLVLDMIRDDISQQCRKGDINAIDVECNIYQLEQLMKISPNIKVHVKEEALKLALELKENMRATTENSLEVLRFLFLLSIYGLVSSFDEGEVLMLFEFAAQHKLAVELFRSLGLADKVSDLVYNLIKKHQHIEAVRFICAYRLVNDIPPVPLLRDYVQNAKKTTRKICKRKPIETKDKARNQEIACLKTVLECIIDNNLESQYPPKEIERRIHELERLKANRLHAPATAPGSSSSSKFEVAQKPKGNATGPRPPPSSKVEVARKPKETATASGPPPSAEVEASAKQKGTATTPWPPSSSKGKKRVINEESVNKNNVKKYINNKRPRTTAVTTTPPPPPLVPPSPTPMYTHYPYGREFMPNGVPAQFGLPPNNFGFAPRVRAGRAGNFFPHAWPRPM